MARISAPLFAFGDREPVETTDEYLRNAMPGGELAMAGPSTRPDGRTIPVRGDLAHIKLAGRYFVPHYAVPMPHVVTGAGAILRNSGSAEADAVCELAGSEVFNVLDITGQWAWGQHGEDGFVGYLPLCAIEAVQP